MNAVFSVGNDIQTFRFTLKNCVQLMFTCDTRIKLEINISSSYYHYVITNLLII